MSIRIGKCDNCQDEGLLVKTCKIIGKEYKYSSLCNACRVIAYDYHLKDLTTAQLVKMIRAVVRDELKTHIKAIDKENNKLWKTIEKLLLEKR